MARLPKIKLRAIPVFPSNVTGDTGIVVEKANGAFTISLDVSDFHISNVPDDETSTTYAVSFGGVTTDNPNGVYSLTPFAGFQGASSDLTSLAELATFGIVARIADADYATRTNTGTANRITVANGGGIAGNPTYDISTSYVGQVSITTLGTVGTGVWQATTIAVGFGGTGLASYTIGDLLQASASATLAKLAAVATGNALISGGVGTVSVWGKIGLTTHISGVLAEANGGTNQSTYATGDTLYASAANTLSKLTGNITTTRKFLRQTGTGSASQAPAWDTMLAADIPASALTKTDDTNVTLTLGGTPATALLQATSITVGWTGTLAPSRGGFGADVSAASGVPLFAAGVVTFTSTSGTGNFARVTAPTFVTPTLGVASATTLNGNTFTTGTYTLTGAAGKTFTFSNTITLAGTDATTMTFPTTSATLARTDAANTFTGHQTIEGVTSTGATGTGNLVFSASPTLSGTVIVTGNEQISGSLDIGTGGASGMAVNSNKFIVTSAGNTTIAGTLNLAAALTYGGVTFSNLTTGSGSLVGSASPTFTGTPAGPTAAVDTNTTQFATTAMVLAQAASATPLIDGTAAVGTSTRFARGDHVHPTDTTKVATVKKQVFVASGTYTPSTGMLYCTIECVGGGAGGGSAAGTALQIFCAGGGGGGGYSRLLATAATIGASKTVTIGAGGAGGASGSNNGSVGGDTSVGTLCIGKGGSGGEFGSVANIGLGGAGGIAGTGDLTAAGSPGGIGYYNGTANNILQPSGHGGSSYFGGGGAAVFASGTTAAAGTNAGNYGGGGAGAMANNLAGNAKGGDGSAGVVIITEYCSQ